MNKIGTNKLTHVLVAYCKFVALKLNAAQVNKEHLHMQQQHKQQSLNKVLDFGSANQ